MKKSIKITLSILLLISTLIGNLFALLESVMLIKIFNNSQSRYHFLHILTIIILIGFIALSITSFITFFAVKTPKSKCNTQLYLLIITFAIILVILITSLVMYSLNIYYVNELESISNLNYYEDTIEELYSIKCVSNLLVISNYKTILLTSIFALIQTSFNFIISKFSIQENKTSDYNTEIDSRNDILKEIDEMKKQLELKKLKDEYSTLYKQLHSNDQ